MPDELLSTAQTCFKRVIDVLHFSRGSKKYTLAPRDYFWGRKCNPVRPRYIICPDDLSTINASTKC